MAYGNTAKDGTGTFYHLVLDANGYLKVITQAGGAGAGVIVDDAAFTPATNEVIVMAGFADETAPDSVDEGDAGAVRMSLDRMLLVQASGRAAEDAAAAGNPVQIGGRYDAAARTLDDGDVGMLAVDAAGRLIVVGVAAEDAAVSGSPVLTGGRYDATDRTLDTGDVGALAVDAAGRVKTLDEGNQEVTALSSAARAASTNSSDLTNPGARGVILTLDVTAITDTPSITLNIEYKDSVSGEYEACFSAAAAVTAVGTHTYVLYPGDIVAADDVVEVGKLPLSRTWRVAMTHADADSITYSVAGSYVL